MGNPKLYNLELHKKINGKWVHHSTIIWTGSSSLCYGEKKKLDSVKAHFEFYKVVPNEPKLQDVVIVDDPREDMTSEEMEKASYWYFKKLKL